MQVRLSSVYEAQHMFNVRHLHCVTITVWTWDALVSCSDEIEVFAYRRLSPIDVFYLLSRVFTGLTIYCALPIVVAPLKDCDEMIHVVCWCGATAGLLSTLLFLLRVNSVFYDSKPARLAFTVLWGTVSSSLFVLPFALNAATLESSGLCAVSRFTRLGTVPSLSIGVFDVTVFVSISYRILVSNPTADAWERIISFFTGTNIGPVSKALIQTGQLYFFPMVGVEGFILWIEFIPPFEPLVRFQYQGIALLGGLVILNTMACRVFRLLRLNTRPNADTPTISVPFSVMRFNGGGNVTPVEDDIELSTQDSA